MFKVLRLNSSVEVNYPNDAHFNISNVFKIFYSIVTRTLLYTIPTGCLWNNVIAICHFQISPFFPITIISRAKIRLFGCLFLITNYVYNDHLLFDMPTAVDHRKIRDRQIHEKQSVVLLNINTFQRRTQPIDAMSQRSITLNIERSFFFYINVTS